MTWQAVAAFLACARIGAVHSAVFAGFSAESLRDRVNDCECRVVITTEYVAYSFLVDGPWYRRIQADAPIVRVVVAVRALLPKLVCRSSSLSI